MKPAKKDLSKMTTAELMSEAHRLLGLSAKSIEAIDKDIQVLAGLYAHQLPFTRKLAKRALKKRAT